MSLSLRSSTEFGKHRRQFNYEKNRHDRYWRLVRLHFIPLELAEDQTIRRMFDRPKPFAAGYSSFVLDSSMTIGRAHFYVALSSELKVPLVLDPIRSRYFEKRFQQETVRFQKDTASKVVASSIPPRGADHPLTIRRMTIPSVADYVCAIAEAKRISVREATLEVRSSQNAAKFRQWCSELVALEYGAYRHTEASHNETERIFAEIAELGRKWARNVGENVNYKTRTLTLAEVPGSCASGLII